MTNTAPTFPSAVSRGLLAGSLAQCLVGLAIVLAMAGALDLLGRPLTCECGTVLVWDGNPHSPGSSQQFADWYSALHVVFGIGLFLALHRARPQWPTGWLLLTTLVSSAIWEVAENTPFIIALFGQAVGAPAYHGDSVLNAVGDTVFVTAGFLAARVLPLFATIALAVLLEVAIATAISDGFVLGTLRLVGIAV